ncbi:hypothetical protein DK870_03575 [Pseudomonas sp. Q1]|nr:hypothetical protein [Pseudomonas sp. Q1]
MEPVKERDLKRLLLTIGTLLPLAAYAGALNEMYPGPWIYEFNNTITDALVQAKVDHCENYRYRVSRRSNGEFLVYCSRDNEKNQDERAYIVVPETSMVMGPYEPSFHGSSTR